MHRKIHRRTGRLAASCAALLLALSAPGAIAAEATGTVVWYDSRSSSLLLECPEAGCAGIPNSKAGETYTFAVPEAMKKTAASLKEGGKVTFNFDDSKEKGYVINAFK